MSGDPGTFLGCFEVGIEPNFSVYPPISPLRDTGGPSQNYSNSVLRYLMGIGDL